MKQIQTWRWTIAALLVAVAESTGRAEGLAIQSFDGAGRLTFNALENGTNYFCRVEWAPSPAGPWTNTWKHLAEIPMPVSGVVTCSVPMCYRVVAIPSDYVVVDLSGGPTADAYPMSYLGGLPSSGWTDEYKTTKLVLRRIPAGVFPMGSPEGELGRNSVETQHQVTLTEDFYIGVFEVTQRQWELVMGNKPSYFNNATYYATRPVEQVVYHEIRENPDNSAISPNWPTSSQVHPDSFMGKLRAKTGLTGFDLPTESQWEYACRAGTTTALNSGYNLTSTTSDARMSEVGRYAFNHPGGYSSASSVSTDGGTAAAGSFLANAWGLYDMHANVWEWCLDWNGVYPGAVTDPKGATSGLYRVLRGGGWRNDARDCRSAYRFSTYPDYRNDSVGFRAAMSPL